MHDETTQLVEGSHLAWRHWAPECARVCVSVCVCVCVCVHACTVRRQYSVVLYLRFDIRTLYVNLYSVRPLGFIRDCTHTHTQAQVHIHTYA